MNIFRPGWNHAWHFDESEYTTTLCLQQPEEGGEFEFTAPLRASQGELAEEQVASVLAERSAYEPELLGDGCGHGAQLPAVPVSTAPFEPGALQIFGGRYSLHHVKSIPKTATRDRLVAVLCFATEPDMVNSPEVQQMFWGRST